MKRLIPALLAAACLHVSAQSIPGPDTAPTPPLKPSGGKATSGNAEEEASAPSKPSAKGNRSSNAVMQATIDRLSRTNQELLDLLDRQQKVLQDLQVDRRLQSRQIMLVEQRLEETLHLNASLQAQISKLQAEAEAPRPTAPAANDAAPAKTNAPTVTSDNGAAKTNIPPSAAATPKSPPPPESFLPPESTGGAPGTMWWHRLMLLSGDDSEDSKTFHVTGKTWRVLWHNQDKPGAAYKNTSALFISAFPANDTIPKKVCSKLGSGGDSTELSGSGDYYLRIEASGGHWELAVEDFH